MVKTTTETSRMLTWPFRLLNNSTCKLNCEERGSKADTLLLFMCAMKIQVLTGHVTVLCVSVVNLANYMVDLTIPFCVYIYIYIYIDLIMLNFLLRKFLMELHVVQLLMCGQICAGSNWYGIRGCEQQGVLWLRVWQDHHTRRCDHPEEGTSIWCMLSHSHALDTLTTLSNFWSCSSSLYIAFHHSMHDANIISLVIVNPYQIRSVLVLD